ncbi:MAG: 3-oxoacid CoA-transferase subunit A [Chloroflexi bacterium]|nr:3-oxoacid CoA-transferase subunit A [Chloroflexota bacterium]
MPVDKSYPSFREAVADIPDGASIMVGGFGGAGGMPTRLIKALRDHGAKRLTIISNTAGIATATGFGWPMGEEPIDHSILFANHQVARFIGSYPVPGSASRRNAFQDAFDRGEVELEIVPQGTFVERMRAAGAGIPAFFTPTGVGTDLAKGKETRSFDGREYVMERWLTADFAFVRAKVADTLGNLMYAGTSRTFNPAMATAAETTIAEVDEIVTPGGIDPERVGTPGIYVNRVVARSSKQ